VRFEALILALLLAWMPPAWAGEIVQLEPVGPTSAVVETDLGDELRQRAVSVDVEQLRNAQARYQPANLHALPRAEKDTTTVVDLTHTLEQDVQDANGQVLYPAGFTFNPLRYVFLSGALVVIDGSDPEQVAWFKGSPYAANRRALLLLSGGLAAPLRDELRRPVAYLTEDIAQRLQLRAVPSVVVERDNQLEIREVSLGRPR
jgi:conjugal transfer pilus assembly protein TraW